MDASQFSKNRLRNVVWVFLQHIFRLPTKRKACVEPTHTHTHSTHSLVKKYAMRAIIRSISTIEDRILGTGYRFTLSKQANYQIHEFTNSK